jgi:hypothetical protein
LNQISQFGKLSQLLVKKTHHELLAYNNGCAIFEREFKMTSKVSINLAGINIVIVGELAVFLVFGI